MLGKAGEIRTQVFDADFIDSLSATVNKFLIESPNVQVVDIRFQTIQLGDSNSAYHTALIIYKEESPC